MSPLARVCLLVALLCLVRSVSASDSESDAGFVANLFASLGYNNHLQHFPDLPYISYVSFPQALAADAAPGTVPLTISGVLTVPKKTPLGPMPAVLVCHGSAGIDARGQFYARPLNDMGIVTLEIDMWAPRGWQGGITGRPASVPSTLPDAFGALQFLASLPAVNPSSIGIIGFSWGGVVSMLSATAPFQQKYGGANNLKFAAHVAHYPICWGYNHVPGYSFQQTTGVNILIQSGELDDYDTPTSCSKLLATLPAATQQQIQLKVSKKSTHGFDRLQPPMQVTDPFSHQGAGGLVQFTPNPKTAAQALKKVKHFFEDNLTFQPE